MVSYNKHDLEFILRQIEISEAHAEGADLTELVPNPLLPYGVRTVDGTYNNIIPGREDWGSADQSFPRLLEPEYRDDQDGDSFDTNGPAPGGVVVNTNYGLDGDVVDSDPRAISNLIVDQTLNNPAAITAALKYIGITGAEAAAIVEQVSLLNASLAPLAAAAQAAASVEAIAQGAVNAAQQALADAQAANPATAATVDAYNAALAANVTSLSAATALADASSALALALSPGAVDAADLAAFQATSDALGDLLVAANAVLVALQADPNVAPADVTAAQDVITATAGIQILFSVINLGDANVGPVDDSFADLVANGVQTIATSIGDLEGQLNASLETAAASSPEIAAALESLALAQTALDAASGESDAADAALTQAQTALGEQIAEHGLELTDNGALVIPNIAPDEGISAPFNSWMTLFGQFFDHGLDLVTKGGNGTVYIPLEPDDPLYVEGGHTNFMVLTRATPDGEGSHTNVTTPFVDQNQTYTSHASHQVFLREYALDGDNRPVATGHLLEGANGGLATWANVKAQAQSMLGLTLNDGHVLEVPLLATDEYGKFIRGDNGFAQVVVTVSQTVGTTTEVSTVLVEGQAGGLDLANITLADLPASFVPLAGATITIATIGTGHAFLDDIAHNAAPVFDVNGNLVADADSDTGNAVPVGQGGANLAYDDELLDRHFITGDGRGNENIGLTAVHHVFHSEHNRLAEHTKDVVIESGDLAFVKEWLVGEAANPLTQEQLDAINALSGQAKADAIGALEWNGERLFQAARFGTEMQYQHLVFEEFARKVNPAIDLFVFNPTMDVDPAIFAEFAHVVYRFGHSMLTETVDRLGADGQTSSEIGLIEAFLNPLEFDQDGAISHDVAAGAIIRGMTRQTGNEIDEFVTEALRNNLLGLPLDLATINIARARETGVPSLNEARAQFFEMSNSEWLKPYESWVDFAQNLKNPASVINFIAAYGTHEAITSAATMDEMREAATLLVFGDGNDSDGVTIHGETYTDRLAFLNGTSGHEGLGGLNNVDLWIGGLAEAILPFGGMLGSTFTFVFELQLENLQNGDRFYYLSRTQGLHFLTELENNSFSKLIQLNTDLGDDGATHLPGEIFASVDYILEINQAVQEDYDPDDASPSGIDPSHDDPLLNALEPKVVRGTNVEMDGAVYDNLLKFSGGEHVVLGGTEQDDILIGGLGDDSLWGDGGDDLLIGGHGINRLHGGDGDDIIYDGGDISFIHGDAGNDAISGGGGLGELIFGGDGQDFIIAGIDGKEVFGGQGNDFILGSPDLDFLIGGEGDDWIEGGEGFDTIAGDNSELFFNSSVIGHDVMFAGTNENDFDAESGDDIMVQGESVMRNEGMLGFDWAIFKDMPLDAYADMRIPIFTTVEADILRNRFDHTEALSGWANNDTLIGDDRVLGDPDSTLDPGLPPPEDTLDGDELTVEGVLRIGGLAPLFGLDEAQLRADLESGVRQATDVIYEHGNLLIGGGGSDVLIGNGGDDIIDGDAWLNVRIGIQDADGVEIGTAEYMKAAVTMYDEASPLHGVALDQLIFTRQLNPGQLNIVREVLYSNEPKQGEEAPPIDVAVFRGAMSEYTVTTLDGTLISLANLPGPILEAIRVTHTGADGQIDDGSDILRNVEVLQFADQSVNISEVPNSPASGELLIVDSTPGTPAVIGDTFSVDISQIVDANGVPPLSQFSIIWQVEETPGAGDWVAIELPATDIPATGLEFTPVAGMELEGLRIRAVANFTDGRGFPEVLVSAATAALASAITPQGTEGDDFLVGTPGPDVIDALGGNDEVFGLGGADILNGGAGDDLLDGGDGADILNGGAGDDELFGGNGQDTLNGGAGDDELFGGAGADTLNGGPGSDVLDGGAGNDIAIFDGDLADFSFSITPEGRVEVVQGADEDEIISIETLRFNDGDVTFDEALDAAGAIRLPPGTPLFVGDGTAEFIIGSNTGESINGNGGADIIFGMGGADTIFGGNGADTLLGGNGNDEIYGDGGADFLNGENGNDELFGGAGADTLLGGDGNDLLDGGAGADTLDGGFGDDELIGGAGVDTFVFTADFGNDTILDFTGQDIIDLTAFDIAFGNLTIAQDGTDAVITSNVASFGSITLQGVNSGALTADDFEF